MSNIAVHIASLLRLPVLDEHEITRALGGVIRQRKTAPLIFLAFLAQRIISPISPTEVFPIVSLWFYFLSLPPPGVQAYADLRLRYWRQLVLLITQEGHIAPYQGQCVEVEGLSAAFVHDAVAEVILRRILDFPLCTASERIAILNTPFLQGYQRKLAARERYISHSAAQTRDVTGRFIRCFCGPLFFQYSWRYGQALTSTLRGYRDFFDALHTPKSWCALRDAFRIEYGENSSGCPSPLPLYRWRSQADLECRRRRLTSSLTYTDLHTSLFRLAQRAGEQTGQIRVSLERFMRVLVRVSGGLCSIMTRNEAQEALLDDLLSRNFLSFDVGTQELIMAYRSQVEYLRRTRDVLCFLLGIPIA
ncbi:hypothetical protein GMRT_23227 [Giardia muris]|uniref:Uncharacterized protein n=1 Tax=Giardia muris TaxID=5742 RepID=A0A4Z1T152_GIAMU|nr:hypothetical protein GMRT_23227 [Giardia muris]|eukprot:TNJ27633.1 hypothetical protein GMRT_23227 [Giardia muris]